uniref:Uncharacterized protein n=1 Tax=Oryza glumipatula TaxID=40148 RepID=A0A0E0A683_9ORYZ
MVRSGVDGDNDGEELVLPSTNHMLPYVLIIMSTKDLVFGILIIDSTYVGGCKWGTATADHTVGEVRALDGPEEDFTNSTCRTSTCHLLPARWATAAPPAAGQRQRAAAEQTQGQQQHLGFGTQLGMNAANGFAGGVGNTLARESIHHVTNYAVRSISSHHHRDGQPPEDYDGNAAGVAETIAYNHAETGGSWEHV